MSRGMFIVLYGPDGSGKSTVVEGLKLKLECSNVKVSHFHWRPRVIPPKNKDKIFKYDITRPDNMPTRSVIASFVLYFYFFVDFILGYVFLIKSKIRKGEVVIYERYYYDILVHPKRYRLVKINWFGRLLCRAIPSPDIIVVLHGDPKIIHGRKNELPVSEIERQQKVLIKLFGSNANVKYIDVTSELPNTIVTEILSFKDIA